MVELPREPGLDVDMVTASGIVRGGGLLEAKKALCSAGDNLESFMFYIFASCDRAEGAVAFFVRLVRLALATHSPAFSLFFFAAGSTCKLQVEATTNETVPSTSCAGAFGFCSSYKVGGMY